MPSWLVQDLQSAWQLFGSYHLNILLVVVPFGLLSGALRWHPIIIFTFNFLAVIPLESLSSYGLESLALRLRPIPSGLLTSVLGSATEIIVKTALLLSIFIRSDLLSDKYCRSTKK